MNAKDLMIDTMNQESPWLTLAKRIVREDRARQAAIEEVRHESVQRVEISEA